MKKYLIKEIYNEYNSDYFDMVKDDIIDNFNSDIFLLENRDNGGINDDLIKLLINELYEYSSYELEYCYKNHYTSFIIDKIKPYKRLSLKQAINIMLLLKDNNINKYDFIKKALSIIYNATYEMITLKGYCQSDWIKCFYNSNAVNYDFLQYIEAVIFNTGIHIFISSDKIEIDDNIDIDNIDYEIDGYYDYMVNYFLLDDKLKHLSNIIGCDKKEIAFYEIKDVKTITSYKVTYQEVK